VRLLRFLRVFNYVFGIAFVAALSSRVVAEGAPLPTMALCVFIVVVAVIPRRRAA
jgi:hypothetical protein